MPWGSGVVDGDVATLLLVVEPERAVGPALVTAGANNASRIELLVDGETAAAVAAIAALFDPAPSVWRVDDTELSPAEPALPAAPAPAPEIEPLIAELIARPDVESVVEQGELIVECRGLEVAIPRRTTAVLRTWTEWNAHHSHLGSKNYKSLFPARRGNSGGTWE